MNYPYRYAPDTEVFGAIMSAIFNHYRRDRVIDSLKQHDLDYFDADQWYPADRFIKLLEEWSQLPELATNYVSVGMAMIYHIDMPDEIEAMLGVDKLMRLGDFFMSQHRGSGMGEFTAVSRSPRAITYTESTVWPDNIIYGYIYGAAQRYLDDGAQFVLRFVDQHKRQDAGGRNTVLQLTWS